MTKYTITEIAEMCNTSPTTVSRVLNNPKLVAEPLRLKIQKKMKEVGYKPNPFASRLSSKSKWGLALFVFDILNPFFALIMRKISHLAMQHGIPLTVCDTENNREKEMIYLDYLLDNKIGGIIFAEGISIETIERALKYTEIVLIDRQFKEGVVSEVTSDNYNGGRQATEYLLQLNHKNIGFIAGPDKWPSAEERLRGYCDALKAHDIPIQKKLIFHGDLRFESGIRAMEYFLTLPKWPTAIFSANDQMAFGVMSKARSLNISIPEDLSIVGFDNIPFNNFYDTKLTSVEQDIQALCNSAFDIMLKKLDNRLKENGVRRIIVPTKLKIGETCRKLIGKVNGL
ncbi:MAG: LacI family DNA-binding transcriptional regulator [Spirochaetales bacterium]|nr:LacI family DNA-binding transcriptional regulator [Spirochaetales bacterium]